MDRLQQARDFAIRVHGDQLYGDRPYAYHLDAVVDLLKPYGEAAQVAGYLHDVVEDTEVTVDEVAEIFGPLIAACVGILTDEPGDNRKARKVKTYKKMSAVTGEEELALIVKAADRLANMEACIADEKQDLLQTYKNEHEAFRKAVFRDGLCPDLWERLERAAGHSDW